MFYLDDKVQKATLLSLKHCFPLTAYVTLIRNEYGSFQSFARCFFNEVWFEQTLATSLYWKVQGAIDKLLVLVEQSTVGIILYAIPIAIIHLTPVSDFFRSHLECYMKSVADVSIFPRILLLRKNIKIPADSHPTSQLNLNVDGHYQVVPADDSCGIISYLCFCHWFLSSSISLKSQVECYLYSK